MTNIQEVNNDYNWIIFIIYFIKKYIFKKNENLLLKKKIRY